MGCGASSAAVPPAATATDDAAPCATEARGVDSGGGSKWEQLKGHQATLMSTWMELCGVQGAEGGVEPDELPTLGKDKELFVNLGRELSDDEFDASFDNIDEDKDGLIQFNEFLTWYNAQTAAEQKKIRALKVEAELRRRLASGELTPEQSKAARSRLVLAELVRRLQNGELDEEQAKAVRARLSVVAALGVRILQNRGKAERIDSRLPSGSLLDG
jgi:Ca2+-binding EF-hand superfamily protein